MIIAIDIMNIFTLSLSIALLPLLKIYIIVLTAQSWFAVSSLSDLLGVWPCPCNYYRYLLSLLYKPLFYFWLRLFPLLSSLKITFIVTLKEHLISESSIFVHFSNQCNKKLIQNFWTNYTPGNSLVKCVLCSITKTFLSRGLQYKLTVQQFVGGILKKLWRFMTCVRTQYRGYEFLLLGGTSFPCNCRCMEIIVPCDWYFGIWYFQR